MGHPLGLRCISCGATFDIGAQYKGCPVCLADGHPINLEVVIDAAAVKRTFHPGRLDGRSTSMWRYHELLPVPQDQAVTLGEGGTPLLHVPELGRRMGVPNLYVKVDGMNPTWSFKDRLASSAVSMARQLGASVITGSSSGNAGAATAAYAARGGLPCVLFTTRQFPGAMRVQMGIYGTKLVAVPTIADRWRMVEECVDRFGWFPVTIFQYPLVGSNVYGIEGYKTIAFETVEALGRVPDSVVFPVGAGDAFSGAWKGFVEYRDLGFTDRVPKMVAAEVFGPLEHALANDLDQVEETTMGPTVAISVGLNTSAYQALRVLRQANGSARSASEDEMIEMQFELAASEGIYAEMSSVLSLAVVKRMVTDGEMDPAGTIVAVLTASGLKDTDTTARFLGEIPLAEPTLESLDEVLQAAYGFALPAAAPRS